MDNQEISESQDRTGSNSQRDVSVYLPAGKEEYVPMGEADFVYYKEGTVDLKVLVDGSSIVMAPGDLRKFPRPVTQLIVQNQTTVDMLAVFVVGRGEFIRTRLFLGTAGFLPTFSGLFDSLGLEYPDSRQETGLQIIFGKAENIVETEGAVIDSTASIATTSGALAADGNKIVDLVSNTSRVYRYDLTFAGTWSSQNYTGDPFNPHNLIVGAGIYHPQRKAFWRATALSNNVRIHERPYASYFGDGSFAANVFHKAVAQIADVPDVTLVQNGGMGVDLQGGNIFLATEANTVKEYRMPVTRESFGAELVPDPELVQTLTFSQNQGATYRLSNGYYFVCQYNGETWLYDSDGVALRQYDDGFGFGNKYGVAFNERRNRCWSVRSTTLQEHSLFDLTSSVQLFGVGPGNRANLQNLKDPLKISAPVNVEFHGGFVRLNGAVVSATLQLLRNALFLQDDYLDYVYAIRYHNGANWQTLDTGNLSFKAAEIADNFSVNIEEPVYITTRSGIVDSIDINYVV